MRRPAATPVCLAALLACSTRPGTTTRQAVAPRGDAARCRPLDDVRRELERGQLRRALAALAPDAARGSFCDEVTSSLLRAMLLLDLARYEDAGPVVDELARRGHAEAPALRAELRRRSTPANKDDVARARELYRRALEAEPQASTPLFLEAWGADPPNGLALVRAGLALRKLEGGDVDEATPRRLFERGVAELERETGRSAHAGLRDHLLCVGHFSNDLRVEWLSDSRHVAVRCNDGSAIFDALTGERVANEAPERLDLSRLPRLRFTAAAEDGDGTEGDDGADGAPFEPCGAAVDSNLHLDAERGLLVVDSARGGPKRHVLKDTFRAVSKELAAKEAFAPEWSVHCMAGTALVFVRGAWFNPSQALVEGLGVLDLETGDFVARAAGGLAHLLDGGRVAIRGPDKVTVVGRGQGVIAREKGLGADLSYDGKRLVFVRREKVDEVYHPVWPYLRRELRGGVDEPLGDFHTTNDLDPASFTWPRIGPLKPSSCATLGTMPTGSSTCAHPAIVLDGVTFGSNEEVACSAVGPADVLGGVRPVMCLDPRGPVQADDPWAPSFVCRVGPHVLPLGACTHRLAER